MQLLDLARRRILVLDGAMGTQIQALNLPEAAWGPHVGCLEHLLATVPEHIEAIHRAYLEVGADIIETNTFGANATVLAEYGLADKVEEYNRLGALIARRAVAAVATPDRPRFVAGSIGPGTKLPTMGHTTYAELYRSYRRQVEGLLDGGADLLLAETAQDLLQVKAALAAAQDAMAAARDVPVYVSVTVEQTGALLTGSDMAAVIAILEPFDSVAILGMNCATGPAAMRPHLEVLSRRWPRLVGLYPNAGLPLPCATGICYPESPETFAGTLDRFLSELRINIVGGCCGTTREHIRALRAVVDRHEPRVVSVTPPPPSVASLFSAVDLRQTPPPLYIGERANATGSKAFRDALLADNHDGCFDLLAEQEEQGSHAADLSVAYAGRDEARDMDLLVRRAARECRLPLVIDSNRADVVALALERYAGRAIINSINFEDGGRRAEEVCRMAKRFGAALVCLTIDEQGMAMTAERKVAIAHRLADFCVARHGLRPHDLLIDPLTFTIGSGDATLKTAALETLTALRRIKAELPGVQTILGLSNVSFGLSPRSRQVLNSVFLDLALKAGMDAAILNPRQIIPLPDLPEADRAVALALIENRPGSDGVDPLETFINHFEGRIAEPDIADRTEIDPRQAVYQGILKGKADLAAKVLPALLRDMDAESILNDLLTPAMKEVGDLFGAGALQLPFVLKSAEAMKKAVDALQPHFRRDASAQAVRKLLLATVRGDVHDIGKNLVGIIVSNNGFDVVDLGVKTPVEVIMQAVEREKPDAVGLSGLLVSSALVMAENLKTMRAAGIDIPVLVGGAALTPGFTRDVLQPAYGDGEVAYCADAFAGLKALRDVAEGRSVAAVAAAATTTPIASDAVAPGPLVIERPPRPEPPFWGSRVARDISLPLVFDLINETALFRGRWGYRRGGMTAEEHRRLIEEEVRPKRRELQRIITAERLFAPRMVYGWYPAHADGDTLTVREGERCFTLRFPRRAAVPRIGIPDFFPHEEDVAGFFIVTLGEAGLQRGRALLEKAGYLDYYLLHGLAVEATDALAEYCHWVMRNELGIGEPRRLSSQELVTQAYQGSRYGFGYPSCPDLSANAVVHELLDGGRIGVSVTENFQMDPELSTSALVAWHPQAKYFAV